MKYVSAENINFVMGMIHTSAKFRVELAKAGASETELMIAESELRSVESWMNFLNTVARPASDLTPIGFDLHKEVSA